MRKLTTKKYYSAGLISILLLPLFSVLFLITNNAFTNYGSLELQTWNGIDFKPEIIKLLSSRTFTIITLTGNTKSDETKLNIAAKQIKELMTSKDSLNGIKFHFENKSEYWTLVRVVDILENAKATFYVPYKNNIWFAIPKQPKNKIKTFVCGTKYYTTYIDKYKSKTEWQKGIEIVKKFFLPIIVYIFMVIFMVRELVNEDKSIQ